MSELASYWLQDQSLSFAAALLSGNPNSIATAMAETCVDLIRDNLFDNVFALSDTTLSLIASVGDAYDNPDYLRNEGLEGLAERSNVIGSARETARKELLLRESTTGAKRISISRVFVSHAVCVLKQRHLSANKFFKWLQRSGGLATPGVETIVRNIRKDPGNLDQRLSKLLDDSRDTLKQTRDRIDQIDDLYEVVLKVANGDAEKIRSWWTRICLGYRNSLFCWPLMEYRSPGGDERRGISLPIPLFLFEDGESTHEKAKRNPFGQKTWFKWVTSRGAERLEGDRRYQPPRGSMPAHMEDSRLGWDKDWGSALQIGMDVAKKLWDSQNGRLKYADEEQAQAKLTASLNVDLAPASQIVDSVYGRVPPEYLKAVPEEERYFRLEGGSAEAYWVQAVLGLLLPAREIPLGVVTGRIIYADGAYELGDVQGIKAKLEYAHRAGFPRIVVPGSPEDYSKFDAEEEGLPAHADDADKDSRVLLDDALQAEPETESELLTPKEQVKLFLDVLKTQDTSKSIEINFCKNARTAADAMQPSGWRRATVLRLPQLQVTYGYNQRRLFCREIVRKGERLRREDRDWYFHGGNRWEEHDSQHMEGLDDNLLSETGRAIKFVKRSSFIGRSGNAEATIGKWLAWKDNQVRTGDGIGYKGPGLGILCLRTTEHDNEFRILAAIADLLDVDPDWWERFQWSPRNKAGEMLAELFNNQRADLSISASSAPDVVVIFDDGGLTQRRTNRIFPSDFNHQFLDLLNPRKDVPGAWDPLDNALKAQGDGPIGPTRIIVVYGDEVRTSSEVECEIDESDRSLLEKLAVFRFGCPKQAAYSMLNFGTIPSQRLTWVQAQAQLDQLIKRKLLRRNRNVIFLPSQIANILVGNRYEKDPDAHLHAARALCPILQPSGHFIASNRDRQLEPEPVLEAAWHLHMALALTPRRFRPKNDPASVAQVILTFLRPSPDWDTVKRLRVNPLTRRDSVELARELIATERAISGNPPHSSRIGLMVETLGRLYSNETPSATEREEQAQWVTDVVEQAISDIPPTSQTDYRRQKRFLFSRQIYCLRILGIPLSDTRLAGARAYIENSVTDALDAGFLASVGENFEGLDDFPLSTYYWRCMWNDDKKTTEPERLTVKERSTYAYAAARTNLGRFFNGDELRAAWDEPWIHYFKLTKVGDVEPRQLVSPLETWNAVYCKTEESAKEFGERLLTMNAHVRHTKTGPTLGWIGEINDAVGNLWEFVSNTDPDWRLYGHRAELALKFIRVLAMPEVMPAFCFIEQCGNEFYDRWPQEALKDVSDGWRSLAREVVTCDAGWISMLSSLSEDPSSPIQPLKRVVSWLHANRATGQDQLRFSDPESLIRSKKLEIVRGYERKRSKAIWNGFQILAQKNDQGWAVYGPLRERLLSILLEVDRGSNSWFFALADNRPDPRTLGGAALMIQQAEASVVPQLMHEGLSHKREQFLRNARRLAKMAARRERGVFERVIEMFELSPRKAA